MLFAKCGVQIAGIIFQARSRGVLRGKMEKLYKKLESYGKSDFYPFHMPGHKRNKNVWKGIFRWRETLRKFMILMTCTIRKEF